MLPEEIGWVLDKTVLALRDIWKIVFRVVEVENQILVIGSKWLKFNMSSFFDPQCCHLMTSVE
jgi:hypothetical protein